MMYKREWCPHTASSRGGVSEENVITCKFEDILPLDFTLNAARFKQGISVLIDIYHSVRHQGKLGF